MTSPAFQAMRRERRAHVGMPARRPEPIGRVGAAVVVGALLLGLALRVWLTAGPLGRLDVDESVFGLMARHAAHGSFFTFFWGQQYGGTQEQILAAPLVALAGTSRWALRLLPVALTAIAGVLVWRVGRRTVGDRAGRIAAVLFWIFPAVFVYWSIKPRGFYEFQLVAGLATMLLGLRLVDRGTVRDAALLGLAMGLGVWASPQVAFFALPVMAWMLVRSWRLARYAPVVGCGIVVGALPWIYHNAVTGWPSLHPIPSQQSDLHSLKDFFRYSLPVALGLRRAYTLGWVVPVLAVVVYAAVLAGVAWLLARRATGTGLLLVVAVAYPLVFAIEPYQLTGAFEPRYMFFLSPIVALLVAHALLAAHLDVAGVVALGVASVVGVVSFASWAQRAPGDQFAPRDLSPLVRLVAREHVRDVYAPYNFAYRLTFLTEERTIATPLERIGTRYQPYAVRVARGALPAYAFVRNGSGDRVVARAVREHGLRHRRMVAGDYVLYLFAEHVRPDDLARFQSFGIALT